MENIVKQKLINNQVSIGTWTMLGHTIVTEILANAGFDWVALDMEHGVINFAQVASHCQVLEGKGVVPLCRLPSIQPEYFKWALDAGAKGVIVPWVRSVEDVERSVSYAKYAPEGVRGVALTRVHGFGNSFDDYVQYANQETLVVIMIEHIDAVNEIENILDVPGVDAVFIGPYDLSCSMKLIGQLHHPEVETACSRVLDSAIRKGVAAGLHIVEPDNGELEKRISDGYTFIALGMDVTMLNSASRRLLNGKSL